MLILQGEDGLFYYTHRSLYDQCVVLRDKYFGFLSTLYKTLGLQDEHPAVCDTFMARVPEPLDILGPFLSLVTDSDKLDTIEDMCGALTSMSMVMDFRRMFQVPAEIRKAVKFSLSVREEYRMHWDRFFLETPTFEEVSSLTGRASYSTDVEDAEEEEEEEYEFVGEPIDINAFVAQALASDSTTATAQEEEAPAAAPAAPAPKSGFDLIRDWS